MKLFENRFKRKKKVVIIGAGGHSKAIIEILKSNQSFEIVGCTDPCQNPQVTTTNVLGNDSVLPDLYKKGVHHAFVAIGDNHTRAILTDKIKKMGFSLINVISPFSYISKSAKLGSGIAIMAGSVISADVCILDNTIINTNSSVDHDCLIGKTCHLAPGCSLSGKVSIGDGTFLGTGTKIIDGIKIGSWSILGAGAVVIRDIPDQCLAVGVPARVLKEK